MSNLPDTLSARPTEKLSRNVSNIVHDRARLATLDDYQILDTAPEEGFNDIVLIAAQVCEAPVALVSLVAGDRQWFKARVGFAACQTDLNSSVCAHALGEPDLLVVSDLSNDPRTSSNPLVLHDPFIRFYAGAPLRTPDGHAIGTLCVIDQIPRPIGLTAKQAETLRALARQVVSQLELRRLALAQAKSEAHWRGLFAQLQEGLVIGRVSKDADDRVTDWTYVDVNAAWTEMIGLQAEEAVGRTLLSLFPDIEDAWVAEPAFVVERGEPVSFTRQFGQLGKWFEGRVSALGDDMFVMLFMEVSARVLAEQALAASAKRKAALATLGDCLRAATDLRAMTYTAGSIVGQALGASSAGYAAVDASRTLVIESHWHAAGRQGLEGAHELRITGSYIEDLRAGRLVAISDVAPDAQIKDQADALPSVGIRAVINVPLIEQGELVAIFFAHFAEPRRLTSEEELFLRAAADRTRAGVARLKAEERQMVLNGEISHRLKNTLAMVQAIANQTLKGASDRAAVDAFDRRLMALSTAHDVLLQKDWDKAELGEVLHRVLDTAGAAGRHVSEGPEIIMGSRAVLSTSLLLHELATNASKYGALSCSGGKIEIEWKIDVNGTVPEVVLCWREVGGPPAIEPTRKGFGSRLLRMGLIGSGGTSHAFLSTGFQATFRAAKTQVEQA